MVVEKANVLKIKEYNFSVYDQQNCVLRHTPTLKDSLLKKTSKKRELKSEFVIND